MIDENFIYYDDYSSLLPPYKGFSKEDIKFFEFFKRRAESNIEIVFIKCDHDTIRSFELNKYINRFENKNLNKNYNK